MANKISVLIDVTVDRANKALEGFRSSIANADGAMGKFKAGAASVGSSIKANLMPIAAAAGVALVGFSKKAIDAASSLGESQNALSVTFGENAAAVRKYGEDSVNSYGLSERAFNQAAVRMSAFAKGIAGDTGNVADELDKLMTRAVDFASVMDIDVEDAMTKFSSALSGEIEPMKRYGVVISAAAVENYALAEGLVRSKSEITEQIKLTARAALLMRETETVAGDWANTSDELANSQRKLTARTEDLMAAFGEQLVPALADATNGLVELLGVAEELKLLDLASTLREWTTPLSTIGKVMGIARGETDLLGRSVVRLTQAQFDQMEAARKNGATQEELTALVAKFKEVNAAATGEVYNARDAFTELDGVLKKVGPRFVEIEQGVGVMEARVGGMAAGLKANRDATAKWSESLEKSTDAAALGFEDFSEDAMESIDKFQEELALNILAGTNWKNNLAIIGAATSAEFASYLAEMGLAGAGLVQKMAETPAELDETYALWVASTQVAKRDVVAEIVDMGGKVVGAVNDIDPSGQAFSVGSAIAQGIADGVNGSAWAIEKALRDAVAAGVISAKLAARIKSPSQLFAEEIGEPIAEGIAVGITDASKSIDSALGAAVMPGSVPALSAGGVTTSASLSDTAAALGTGGGAVTINVAGVVDDRLARQIAYEVDRVQRMQR
jgi:hypothetical protein